MTIPGKVAYRMQQFLTCVTFYTRLPVGRLLYSEPDFAASQWAAPSVGIIIGAVGGIVYAVADFCGLPDSVSAALCLASLIVFTGALHEDGLADTADGLGGGNSKPDKLEIMRDSRLGSYGALALLMSCLIRWSSISAIANPITVSIGLIAAHSASRALIPAFMTYVAPARRDGLSARAGSPQFSASIIALVIGAVVLLSTGLSFAVIAALLLFVIWMTMKLLCEHQIGGQTGDVIGALQQGAEVVILLTAASLLG